MGHIPEHIVDDIMSAARIEEVIGDFVQLKRAGSNLKGLSPFTDEKTPSFVVSPSKQIFKCFSTGKGGSAATFLMEKEHYSYPEALRWLADKYGIVIPEDKPATPEELEKISEREGLYIVNNFARDHFVKNLHESTEGKNIGLSYFTERGFRPEIIEKFQLGYCLNKSDGFTAAALKESHKLAYLQKVGLTKTKDDRSFDFFRGRVMFPIHSVSGRVLGFGGRTLLADKKIAKYFNSPESIIYNKSEILYGLHFSKGDIIKYDNCYLCEGYTDVISMYQAGVQNVVSSSGTSLTRQQIQLVKRYTNNITILYDGDAAGIKASFRGIDLILEEGLNVSVVLFPEGEDPDSYAKSVSTSELKEYIESHSQDFISFKAGVLLEGTENDPIKKVALVKQIVDSVSLIPDAISRNIYLQTLSQKFNISEEVLNGEVIKKRQQTQVRQEKKNFKPNVRPTPQEFSPSEPSDEDLIPEEYRDHSPKKEEIKTEEDYTEFDLIRILALYGPSEIIIDQTDEHGKVSQVQTSVAELIVHELEVDELTFKTPLYLKIYTEIKNLLDENSFAKPSYLRKHSDQAIVQFVSNLEMSQHEISTQWLNKHKIATRTELDQIKVATLGSIYTFKVKRVENEIKAIQKTLADQADTIDSEKMMDLLSQQVTLEQVKKIIAQKLGRIVIH